MNYHIFDTHEKTRAHAVFGDVIDSMDEIVYIIDMKTSRILYANKLVNDTFGGDVTGRLCYEAIFNRSGICGDCPREEMLAEGIVPSPVATCETQSPVTMRWYWFKSRIITWHDGRHVQLCCAYDITERRKTEQRLIKLTQTDMMTGCYSRDFGLRLLGDALSAMKESNEPVTVCFMDVDDLKNVNDTFGHAEGDRLLLAIVEAIRKSTRSSDILMRLGGDEFLLVLCNTPYKGAVRVVSAIENSLEEINGKELYPYALSLSIGVYEANDGETKDEILRKADERMYASKQERRKARG